MSCFVNPMYHSVSQSSSLSAVYNFIMHVEIYLSFDSLIHYLELENFLVKDDIHTAAIKLKHHSQF